MLVGAGGEPVDLCRTILSHGLTSLPPTAVDDSGQRLCATVDAGGGRARTVEIARAADDRARVRTGDALSHAEHRTVMQSVRHLLRLDEDLSPFYDAVEHDAELAWVREGAGRLLRSATVFETVIKTVCTTNCSWSATTRMIRSLVEQLGTLAPGAQPEGWTGRLFPTAHAMASADDAMYREAMRAGYRARYLRSLAELAAEEPQRLEWLAQAPQNELPDREVERQLLALPGVGPYAAAHIMLLLGRYSRLVLDSWTRPAYARTVSRRHVSDRAIARRFSRYGDYAGLAFWLVVTRGWLPVRASDLE